MRAVPHTRIRSARITAHEGAHRELPDELTAADAGLPVVRELP
ncbi:hypothetical protein [Streptomyces sp. NPDC006527]